ncbi:MAG TPA: CHAD domain-containing protein [Rhizomicrobium sp.]|jgi:inorganic triphosphatase YgiF
MADEIELKLEVSPRQLARLKRASWLARYATGRGEDHRLVSVYYDTDDLALRDQRAILRVRDADGQFVQTFKSGQGAGLGRLEWECPLDGPKPQLTHARKKRTGGVDLKDLAGALKPVFETTVWRHTRSLRYRGSELELAIDRGQIKTGRWHLPIHEVEIELKRGKTSSVVALGREIAGKLKARYGIASKAERGYALREDEQQAPICAEKIVLSPDMTAGEAFQAIAMSCLHHFAANRDGVIAGKSEGVHQMRIGLRRLRAAISVFKELLRGPQTEKVKNDLKWLTEELGPARDMDVLADEGLASMTGLSAVPAAAKVLKADIVDQRDAGFERAIRAVRSERYRQLVLETVLWINGGKWTRTNVPLITGRRKMAATRFAAQELGRRNRKVLKQLDKLYDISPLKRHKLRIAIKKLRYATGYFESLFREEKKVIAKFSEALKDLQSGLGQLNDIRVHGKLAKHYAVPPRATRGAAGKAFAMGELTGRERAKSRDLLMATKRGGGRLKRCGLFWT